MKSLSSISLQNDDDSHQTIVKPSHLGNYYHQLANGDAGMMNDGSCEGWNIWLEIIVITIILIISALFHPHHHHTISIFCHLSLHTRWHRLVSLSRRPSRRRWQMPEIQKSQHFRLGNLSTVVEKKYLFDLIIKVLCWNEDLSGKVLKAEGTFWVKKLVKKNSPLPKCFFDINYHHWTSGNVFWPFLAPRDPQGMSRGVLDQKF